MQIILHLNFVPLTPSSMKPLIAMVAFSASSLPMVITFLCPAILAFHMWTCILQPTNQMDALPHIILPGDDVWNPACIDKESHVNDLVLNTPAVTGDQDP
jgi:hypothetical protein